jgi:hypothetical protein
MSPTWRMMVSVQRVEGLDVPGDLGAVTAAEALGRNLDRRERVLDLVGDPPGDVLPGGDPLGRRPAW